MRLRGFEPPRAFAHRHLKTARLPFRHSRRWSSKDSADEAFFGAQATASLTTPRRHRLGD